MTSGLRAVRIYFGQPFGLHFSYKGGIADLTVKGGYEANMCLHYFAIYRKETAIRWYLHFGGPSRCLSQSPYANYSSKISHAITPVAMLIQTLDGWRTWARSNTQVLRHAQRQIWTSRITSSCDLKAVDSTDNLLGTLDWLP